MLNFCAGEFGAEPLTAAHLSSVFLDREATVEKAIDTIKEAGEHGTDLIAFPESYVPGYPHGVWTHTFIFTASGLVPTGR